MAGLASSAVTHEQDRVIERLVDGIAKGIGDPAIQDGRMKALSRERPTLKAEPSRAPAAVIALPPAAPKRCEHPVAGLKAM